MAELATSLTAEDTDARLDEAESIVRDFCGWHIAPVRTGETFTVYRGLCGRVYLPTLKLVAVTEILVEGSTAADLSHFAWDAAGWVEPRAGYVWPYLGANSLTITFSHGYVDVPPSVQGVVQSIAQRSVGNPTGLRRQQAGPFVDEYASLLAGSDATALGPYVLPLV